MRIMAGAMLLCTVGIGVAETGSQRVAVSVLARPTIGNSLLKLQFRTAPETAPPYGLSILAKNQSLIPPAFSHNGILGRIKVETAEHGTLLLVMHSLVHSGTDCWNFEVSLEDRIGSLPFAQGELKNIGTGFLLEMAATQWLADLSQKFALPAVVDAEFEFAVPFVPGPGGDLSYSVSTSDSMRSNRAPTAR